MKKTILCLAFISSLFACSHDEDATPETYVRMGMNGAEWTGTTNVSAFIYKSTSTLAVGASTETETITITIPSVSGTGTYNLKPSSGAPGLSILVMNGATPKTYSISNSLSASHGTITISAVNGGTSVLDYVKGTFSGVAYRNATDSLVITNGEFLQTGN